MKKLALISLLIGFAFPLIWHFLLSDSFLFLPSYEEQGPHCGLVLVSAYIFSFLLLGFFGFISFILGIILRVKQDKSFLVVFIMGIGGLLTLMMFS